MYWLLAQPPPQLGFPAPDSGDKKFNSRLVAPTFLKEAFRREHRKAFAFDIKVDPKCWTKNGVS